MKQVYFIIALVFIIDPALVAQSVGIGTTVPQNDLHIYGSTNVIKKVETTGSNHQAALSLKTKNSATDALQIQKWAGGTTGAMAGISLSNLGNVVAGGGAGALLIGTLNNSPVHIITNGTERLRIDASGNVGIGVTNPGFKLDVNGRMRIRHFGQTAGIWFNASGNLYSPGFAGLADDKTIGFYGNAAGWSFIMSTTLGNVSIGTAVASSSKLKLEAGLNVALEVSGGIRVAGSSPAAFQLIANSNNLSDPNGHGYTSIVINSLLCNNDANALLFITPVGFAHEIPVNVFYDSNLGRWKIKPAANHLLTFNGFISFLNYTECGFGYPCKTVNDLALAGYWRGFEPNDKFNILVIKN